MLYLTTGGNGAGKTLLTLRDVREKSVKENRPVVYNGRFELVANFGWKNASFELWQDEPNGTIFIVDECHNDLPIRSASDKRPAHITMLAEHRRRGFDFFLITQHPLNIDSFVRRLISSPGWHRHLKRASGAPLVSVLTWPAVNDKCEKNGAGATAATSMVAYPKEVYDWYKSTSLDTAKIKIPFQAKLLAACLVLVPVLGWYGYKTMSKRFEPKTPVSVNGQQVVSNGVQQNAPPPEKKPMTVGELVDSYKPRLEGLAQTAPRYDELTKPSSVPYPAACVAMAARCDCYTQQGTKLVVPVATCKSIVAGGFFQDWGQLPQPAPVVSAVRQPEPANPPEDSKLIVIGAAKPWAPIAPTSTSKPPSS